MKIAVIGSRNAYIDDLFPYLPADCTEIVSGGAKGIDTCAAPIVRNKQIVDYADAVLAVWDGASKGTESVIEYCKTVGKPCRLLPFPSSAEN